ALGQVQDAFDQADRPHDRGAGAARQERDEEHDQAGVLVAQDELVDAQPADQDAEQAGRHLLAGNVRRKITRHALPSTDEPAKRLIREPRSVRSVTVRHCEDRAGNRQAKSSRSRESRTPTPARRRLYTADRPSALYAKGMVPKE